MSTRVCTGIGSLLCSGGTGNHSTNWAEDRDVSATKTKPTDKTNKLDRGNSSFGTLGREKRRLITPATHGWEEPSRGHQQWVVSILSPRQLLTKSIQVMGVQALQHPLEILHFRFGYWAVDWIRRTDQIYRRFLWSVHTTKGIAEIEMPLARPPFTLMIIGFYKTRNIKMNLTMAVKTEIFFETSLFILHGLRLVMWFGCSRNGGGAEGSAHNLLEKPWTLLLAPCGCQDRRQGRSNRPSALGGLQV